MTYHRRHDLSELKAFREVMFARGPASSSPVINTQLLVLRDDSELREDTCAKHSHNGLIRHLEIKCMLHGLFGAS